jgi:hypothetical protein
MTAVSQARQGQRLRHNQDIRTAPRLGASIFLDILNVFLFLSFLGRGEE